MKKAVWSLLIGLVVIVPLVAQPARPTADWKAWQFLIGEWEGEGTGAPGEGKGGFSLEPDLQGRILVRKNWTDFPAAQGRPAVVHEDVMVIAYEQGGIRAVYWDNEGHVIHYAVDISPDGAITFVSPAGPGIPRFRLSYRKIADDRVGIRFEISSPDKPDEFKVYLDGTARKK